MKNEISNRDLVREYLLGQLDDREEAQEKVSDDIFFEGVLSEMVDSVEDEIIENYEEGALDPTEREAVEKYFLRSPERREKLRFYKMLRRYLEAKKEIVEPQASGLHLEQATTARSRIPGTARLKWGNFVLVYGQMAALLALCIFGGVYSSRIHKTQSLLEGELAQEKSRSESLGRAISQLQPPVVVLTLVSDRSRASDIPLPEIEIKPSTQRIVVEIAITTPSAGPYDVRLETRQSNVPIWAAKLLPLFSPSGDARLVFDLPAKILQAGPNSLVMSSGSSIPPGRRYYDFEVRASK